MAKSKSEKRKLDNIDEKTLKRIEELEAENLKLRIQNAFLKAKRRLYLEEEKQLPKK